MFEKEYKADMNQVKFSEDFEKRTIARLKAEIKPKRRRAGGRTFTALAACAAVLVLALVLYPQLNMVTKTTPEIMAPSMEMVDEMEYETEISVANDLAGAPLPDTEIEPMDGDYADYMYEDAIPAPIYDTSEYSFIQENRFLSALTTPLSTFAASVDTASFANVRGMLDRGDTPPADAVRIEEFVNYFRYDYPMPKAGEPFSVTTEITKTPWNDDTLLLRIGLATEPIATEDLPRSNLVFLIDVSGSMEDPDKLPLCQKAFQLLTEELRAGDVVSIVTYAGYDSVILDGADGMDKVRILTALENLTAGGSTAGSAGIETAYEIAWKHFIKDGNNRVILATDGDLNVGVTSEGDLTRLIEEKRETGVYLSVAGFGYGNYMDDKLEALAIHGKGNYSYIDDEYEAKRVFVEEMGANLYTVCKDAKIQVEFNPEKVSEYRLIGYENRKMDAEDFANDEKDGGQIGAGHQVTALYEIKPAEHPETQNGLTYQSIETTGSTDFATVSIRAKKPDSDVSDEYRYAVGEGALQETLTGDMAFIAAVVEFGMTLRDSAFKGNSSFESAAELLKNVDVTKDPRKDDFAYLVRKMAR